jgi:hypothetical protein
VRRIASTACQLRTMEHLPIHGEPSRKSVRKAATAQNHAAASESESNGSKMSNAAVQPQPGEEATAQSQHSADKADAEKDASSFPLTSLPSDLLLQVLLSIGSAELLRLCQVRICIFARAQATSHHCMPLPIPVSSVHRYLRPLQGHVRSASSCSVSSRGGAFPAFLENQLLGTNAFPGEHCTGT